jgi:2,3-bisphosphoglycerate-dependent phosphoglycerate mutase
MMSKLSLLFLALIVSAATAFIPTSGLRGRSSSLSMKEVKYKLVLIRHGESTWNLENKFTGWVDVPLSETGIKEAKQGGKLMKENGFQFDIAYTSYLKRAIGTLWNCLTELDQMNLPVVHSWRLNERHYGALQGLDKQATVDKYGHFVFLYHISKHVSQNCNKIRYGKDQVTIWRRSYDIPPPACEKSSVHYPGNDIKYKDVPAADLPLAESLELTEKRFLVDWKQSIAPKIKSGSRVLIAAHGNTLRALVKYLDDIPTTEIVELNIPTGVPLVYYLDEDLKPVKAKNALAPLSGEYLGNQEEIKNRIQGVKNQTK